MIDLSKVIGFEWDKGNRDKSHLKHSVSQNEAEQVFVDEKLQVERDIKHQEIEDRFIAIGQNSKKTVLFIIFTMRNDKIRIISARIANKKERRLYEKKVKKNTKI